MRTRSAGEPGRLLIRTASNAWIPKVVSVLSLPDRGSEVDQAVEALWDRLQVVKGANALGVMKSFPDVANSRVRITFMLRVVGPTMTVWEGE